MTRGASRVAVSTAPSGATAATVRRINAADIPFSTVGGDLFGPTFLRIVGKFRSCDCSQPACKSAGYFPGQDALYTPASGLQAALKSPNLLSSETKQQLKDKKRKILCLCAWHFFWSIKHGERATVYGSWTLSKTICLGWTKSSTRDNLSRIERHEDDHRMSHPLATISVAASVMMMITSCHSHP